MNGLHQNGPNQDTKQFLMKFLVSPDTNSCIVHKDEGEKSTSKLLVFLTSDLFLNTDLILRFVGHEALWYHRRFLLTIVKDLVRCGISKRNECSSEKSILEHENGEEDCENNGSLLHNGSNNIHLSNEGIPLEKDQKLSSIEILHDSNIDNLLRMTLLDQEQTLIAKCLPEDIHQYSSIFTGLIVTASQGSDSLYNYNTVTVVLFTEILKLIVSTALYYKE
uniref:Uncharacterized protein n=1 Tax=Timema tahoe TaxID=61484 RepID=A0A7R9FN29_9NEOP|nr:unnamed protein product [Timema tahoe]